jgi:uncharacterized protein YqeY
MTSLRLALFLPLLVAYTCSRSLPVVHSRALTFAFQQQIGRQRITSNTNQHSSENEKQKRRRTKRTTKTTTTTATNVIGKFITLEKERMDKIVKYEKKRLESLNEFLSYERKRLEKLEKQEKKVLSMLLDDGTNRSSNTRTDSGLSSTLTRIGDNWQMSKQRSSGPTSTSTSTSTNPAYKAGWTKLILEDSSSSKTTATTTTTNGIPTFVPSEEEYVYLYEPSNSKPPSMIIMFLGGAGLGQFPHITYSEMISRISHKLNAAIITTPYKTGLDHYELSKETSVRLHKALTQCQESGRYSTSIPKFFLGHSLGSKLWTISTAAMNDIIGDDLAGVGLISFNNFGFVETTKQVKSFTETMNMKNTDTSSTSSRSRSRSSSRTIATQQTAKMIDTLLEFAEQAVTLTGLEFSPSPSATTERIINKKYDQELLQKTRLFVFDDDDLDSSKSFVDAVQNPSDLSISGLPGSHLAPIFIKLGLDDFNVPQEAQQLAEDAVKAGRGFESVSYGDEDYLVALVDEICDWVMGKDPSRGPLWQKEKSIVLQ